MLDDRFHGSAHTRFADVIERIRCAKHTGGREAVIRAGRPVHYAETLIADLPLFVVSDEARDLIQNRPEIHETLRSLMTVGLARLPFDPVLVELHALKMTAVVRIETDGKVFKAYPILRNPDGNDALVTPQAWFPIKVDPSVRPEMPFILGVNGIGNVFPEEGFQFPPNAFEVLGMAVLTAISAVMLANAGALATESVEAPHRLNKRRIGRGRPPIPAYTVITVTRPSEEHRQAVMRGGSVSPHWRSGHVRWQRYGPRNTLRKPIYIATTLVAHRKGDPIPPREVLT